MKRVLVVCLALALLALVGAGCGGDDDTSSVTKAQLLKKGDAICKKASDEQLAGLQKAIEKNPKLEKDKALQEEAIVTYGLAPISDAAEELAALGAPEGDEEEVEEIITGMEDAVEESEEDPAPLVAGTTDAFNDVNKAASAYGFKECAELP
jgi:hypothetical protein